MGPDPVPGVHKNHNPSEEDIFMFTEAVNLYLYAKDFLAQRISHSAFFGNLNIMKWLIDDLYELIEFDEDYFDFFDLYYMLRTPHKVSFIYEDNERSLESVREVMSVRSALTANGSTAGMTFSRTAA